MTVEDLIEALEEVEDKTIAIYLEGYEKITGKKLV